MKKENKTQYVTVRLSDEIMAKLKAEAEKNTRSLSAQVLHYIRMELDKVREKNAAAPEKNGGAA